MAGMPASPAAKAAGSDDKALTGYPEAPEEGFASEPGAFSPWRRLDETVIAYILTTCYRLPTADYRLPATRFLLPASSSISSALR